MGLFDGATAMPVSTADLAAATGWPVLLVVDAQRAGGESAAAVVRGFATHRPGVGIAAVVFNRVGGERHAAAAARGLRGDAAADPGAGLPAAGRRPGVAGAASRAGSGSGASRSRRLPRRGRRPGGGARRYRRLRALAQPGWGAWRRRPAAVAAGAAAGPADRASPTMPPSPSATRRCSTAGGRRAPRSSPFSPLADEPPDADADAVYLPGGYPELHAGRLAGNAPLP